MKRILLKTFTIGLFCSLAEATNAQQTIPAAGNNASGSGGSVSYTIGQTFYSTDGGSPNGVMEQGVQIVDLSGNPLPITLISFSGLCNDGKVQLNWETASEKNNEAFQVEKSKDAVNWSILAEVKGSGTSNVISRYTYTDTKPDTKATYYRLQQTDINGEATYSNIISVTNCDNHQSSIVIYPNPTADGVFISSDDFTNTTYELSDIKGSVLSRGKLSGQQTFIPLAQLAAATYIIKINPDNNAIKTFKISKR